MLRRVGDERGDGRTRSRGARETRCEGNEGNEMRGGRDARYDGTYPATRNPQPATRNPQPETRNPKLATRNQKLATSNPQPANPLTKNKEKKNDNKKKHKSINS